MWSKYKYFILSGLALLLIGVLESMKPKETIWLESYSKHDKIPYGNFILYNELESVFSKPIFSSSESLTQTLADSILNTNLIIINNTFEAEGYEVNALLKFVEKGNQVLIVSRRISESLLDTLGLQTKMEFDEKFQKDIRFSLSTDTTQYESPKQNILFRTYFHEPDSSTVLGIRSDGFPNFIGTNYGKGSIFINLTPSAFSNVFMLTGNNHQYVSQVLSHLSNQPIIWDEYYKVRKQYLNKTPFQHVLVTDGLREALYLMLLGTLLYMAFASKRKQRVIPVISPKSNSTVEFIETIGQLYYNESDHKNIGIKRIN